MIPSWLIVDHTMNRTSQNILLTATEACQYLNITQRALNRYLKNRQIPGFKLGTEWRFVRSDLAQWTRD